MRNLSKEATKYVESIVHEIKSDGGTPLFVTKFGSELYGTNTSNSDEDVYVIYRPSITSLIKGEQLKTYRAGTSVNKKGEKNNPGDVDVQALPIQHVLSRFIKGELVSIDLLFALTNRNAVVCVKPSFVKFLHKYIYSGVISARKLSGVLGYINTQASKYGVKGTRLGQAIELRDYVSEKFDNDARVQEVIEVLKIDRKDIVDGTHVKFVDVAVTEKGGRIVTREGLNVLGKVAIPLADVGQLKSMLDNIVKKYGVRAEQAKNNMGIDWKALSHALRAAHEYMQYVATGMVRFPLDGETVDTLVKVKTGTMDFSVVKEMLERSIQAVELANNQTRFRLLQTNVEEAEKEALMFLYRDIFVKETQ